MNKELKRIRDDLVEALDGISKLERANRSLKLEFTELYDKVSHQMSRMAKRYAHREKADEILPEEEVIGEPVIGSDSISQSILARRTRGRHG